MRNKQISGGAILSLASQMITIIVGLVYTPIMIRMLGPNEYGLYQLVLSVVNYLNLMNFGFNGAYIRYYSIAVGKNDEEEVAKVNGMFMNVFCFIGVLCLVAGIGLFFNIGILGTQLTSADYVIAKQLLVILVINLAISFPNSLFIAYMSAREEFIVQKALNIGVNILIPILNLPLLYLGYGSVGVVGVTLALTIIRLIINAWYCVSKLSLKMRLNYFDKAIFRGLLGYTFFIFLSDLVDQLNSNVDKFLLGRITGTIAVAIYSVGFNLKNYYTTLTWIVPEMYVPEVNRVAIQEKNDNRLTELFTFIGRINNYIVLLVISGFFLVGREFIRLWIGSDYDISYYATLILMITGYIPAVQTLGVNVQNAKNMHKMRSIVYFIVACCNVALSIVLIKRWGVVGTCFGTLIATLLGHGLFMNYYYHNKLGLNIIYFWKKMCVWYPPVILMTLAGWFVTTHIQVHGWFNLILFIMVYTVIYMITMFFVGLNSDERNKLSNVIKRRFK